MILRSDKAIHDSAKILHDLKEAMSKTAFKELQQAMGLNYSEEGLLLDQQLMGRYFPVDATCYDWMHIYLVNGIWNRETGKLMGQLQIQCRITYKDIHAFCREFVWPRSSGGAANVFEKRAENKDVVSPIACSASEGLGIYSVLRVFLSLRAIGVSAAMTLAVAAYFAMCDVLNLLSRASLGDVSPSELQRAILKHFAASKLAYGDDDWVPKYHFALHLPYMLRRFERLISCWVHERKHKIVKLHSNNILNTACDWEKQLSLNSYSPNSHT
jgi:hypothetical protein